MSGKSYPKEIYETLSHMATVLEPPVVVDQVDKQPVPKGNPVLLCDADGDRTQQEHLEDVRIDKIIERWRAKKEGPEALNLREPHYGHFDQAFDLVEAERAVEQAYERFMELDPKVRELADNDPARLIEMLDDPQDLAELVDAGLDVVPFDEDEIAGDPPATQDMPGAAGESPPQATETPPAPDGPTS